MRGSREPNLDFDDEKILSRILGPHVGSCPKKELRDTKAAIWNNGVDKHYAMPPASWTTTNHNSGSRNQHGYIYINAQCRIFLTAVYSSQLLPTQVYQAWGLGVGLLKPSKVLGVTCTLFGMLAGVSTLQLLTFSLD